MLQILWRATSGGRSSSGRLCHCQPLALGPRGSLAPDSSDSQRHPGSDRQVRHDQIGKTARIAARYTRYVVPRAAACGLVLASADTDAGRISPPFGAPSVRLLPARHLRL